MTARKEDLARKFHSHLTPAKGLKALLFPDPVVSFVYKKNISMEV